jgi:multidrug efflux system outer membrane protein
VTTVRSFQFPELNLSGSAVYSHVAGERDALQPKDQFSPIGGFDLGFELDFWGRFRRATEAARADLLGSLDARRFVISTLVTDVASSYLGLLAFDAELEVSRRTLVARQDSLRLVRMREAAAWPG